MNEKVGIGCKPILCKGRGNKPEKKGEPNVSLILLRERGRKSGQRGDGEQGPT